jgi:hypothetical protein
MVLVVVDHGRGGWGLRLRVQIRLGVPGIEKRHPR